MVKSLVCTALLLVPSTTSADPCGMVPPAYTGPGPAIQRVGEQRTYAFFHDGVETFVIKPGFEGKVDNFGMLIPFPTPPAIRKVPDLVFEHIQAAIDPPQVNIDLSPRYYNDEMSMAPEAEDGADTLGFEQVRVLRQEAVGMYDIAVLEAGSPKALERWMGEHGYRYPSGMDAAVGDYVRMGWPFVAVKTRVGDQTATRPRPGMRGVNPALPAGATFDGAVQAMGFRFRVAEPVIPMRLSAFNEGELRNIVYFLTDRPVRLNGLPTDLVRRQIGGGKLYHNVTQLLAVRLLGGKLSDIDRQAWDNLDATRDPAPYNRHARDLFASDLMAVRKNALALPFEEREKVMLRIDEALNLRGPDIDGLRDQVLTIEREQTLSRALTGLRHMTLSLVDGDFPRRHLADHNLTFEPYRMRSTDNTRIKYDARSKGPGFARSGQLIIHQRPPEGNAGVTPMWVSVQ